MLGEFLNDNVGERDRPDAAGGLRWAEYGKAVAGGEELLIRADGAPYEVDPVDLEAEQLAESEPCAGPVALVVTGPARVRVDVTR